MTGSIDSFVVIRDVNIGQRGFADIQSSRVDTSLLSEGHYFPMNVFETTPEGELIGDPAVPVLALVEGDVSDEQAWDPAFLSVLERYNTRTRESEQLQTHGRYHLGPIALGDENPSLILTPENSAEVSVAELREHVEAVKARTDDFPRYVIDVR